MTKRLALALLLVGLCLVVATASALTPSRWSPVAQNEFRALSSSVPGSAGTGCPPLAYSGPCWSGDPSTPPSTRPAPTARPLRTYLPAISGVATYYAYHQGQAAAARALRAFLGPEWRGMTVTVCAQLCLRIRLTDYEASAIPGRLIDLSSGDFRRICGPLSQGVCHVSVSR